LNGGTSDNKPVHKGVLPEYRTGVTGWQLHCHVQIVFFHVQPAVGWE
jgi:hypothetical protein